MSSFLQNYKRQPKLFIDLPSQGHFYDHTVIASNKFTSIPVFGMNAMDEILFKTPDALFTGNATAEVIKSCIPDITDPWQLVGFDIDYVLVAIRIATYTDDLPVKTTCPSCNNDNESILSLTTLIENFNNYKIENNFQIDDLTFKLKPLTYKQMSDIAIENYTLERQIIQIAKNKDFTDNQRDNETQKIYNKMNELNLRTAVLYIASIDNSANTETDAQVIKDFILTNDTRFYKELKENIFSLSNQWKLPDLEVVCGDEGCENKYKSQIDLDYSNFFGLQFLHSRNLIN